MKLKPCPFCNETEGEHHETNEGQVIRCAYCGALGPWDGSFTGSEEQWNIRKGEE